MRAIIARIKTVGKALETFHLLKYRKFFSFYITQCNKLFFYPFFLIFFYHLRLRLMQF